MKTFNINKFLASNKKIIIKKEFLRLDRLEFLKKLIQEKKRLRVIEFGTGISTLVIAKCLQLNKIKYENIVKKFREKNFICHTIDNNKKFLNYTKKNILTLGLTKFCKINFVDLIMQNYSGYIVSGCNYLPNINPDLILLDGPDQSLIKGSCQNINFSNTSFTPIQVDILKMEPYLIPGTIILIDGRTNNALFLKKKLYRKWKYKYFKKIDQHLFELADPVLGNYNKSVLKFYNSKTK